VSRERRHWKIALCSSQNQATISGVYDSPSSTALRPAPAFLVGQQQAPGQAAASVEARLPASARHHDAGVAGHQLLQGRVTGCALVHQAMSALSLGRDKAFRRNDRMPGPLGAARLNRASTLVWPPALLHARALRDGATSSARRSRSVRWRHDGGLAGANHIEVNGSLPMANGSLRSLHRCGPAGDQLAESLAPTYPLQRNPRAVPGTENNAAANTTAVAGAWCSNHAPANQAGNRSR
jgi:hypothetical protein